MIHSPRYLVILVMLASAIAACKGGVSVDISGPKIGLGTEISEPVASIGVVIDMNDVLVNGVLYDTSSATVALNGATVTSASILPGHYVHLDGRITGPGITGTARFVKIESNLVGPLERVDSPDNRITVLGQTVIMGAHTHLGPGIEPGDLGSLPLDTILAVSGYATAEGQLAATRIDIAATGALLQIIGRVSDIDLASLRIGIGQLAIDYSAVSRIELPTGSPGLDGFVQVRGTLAGGVFVAQELAAVHGASARSTGERTYLEGLVTRVVDNRVFETGASRFTVDSTTEYRNGNFADIGNNTQLRVYGRVGDDGVTINADRIEFLALLDRHL